MWYSLISIPIFLILLFHLYFQISGSCLRGLARIGLGSIQKYHEYGNGQYMCRHRFIYQQSLCYYNLHHRISSCSCSWRYNKHKHRVFVSDIVLCIQCLRKMGAVHAKWAWHSCWRLLVMTQKLGQLKLWTHGNGQGQSNTFIHQTSIMFMEYTN